MNQRSFFIANQEIGVPRVFTLCQSIPSRGGGGGKHYALRYFIENFE